MTLTKACARVGCPHPISAPGPKGLAARTWCSVSCAVSDRVARGWQPHSSLTPASRAKGGAKGGKLAGLRRRKACLLRHVKQMEPLLTEPFRDGLSPEQVARVKVLLGRAHRRGHRIGYRAGFAASRYRPRVAA